MHAAVIGTTVTVPDSVPYRLFVNNQDILATGSGSGVPIESITWELGGSGDAAAFRATHNDPTGAVTFQTHAEVRFWSAANDTEFGGYLVGRTANPAFGGQGRITSLVAIDYSIILDRNIVTSLPAPGGATAVTYPAGMSDRDIIQGLLGNFCIGNLQSSGAYIQNTNSNMPAMTFAMQSLRSALDQVAVAANADSQGERTLFVDEDRRVHYLLTTAGSAPYNITDSLTPAGGERTANALQIVDDDSNLRTAVYVIGGTAAGTGWVWDGAKVAQYGWRADTLDVPDSTTAGGRRSYGGAYLFARSQSIRRGSFTVTGTSGWRGDQTLTITSTGLGLAAVGFAIKHVTVTVLSGAPTLQHVVEFGARKPRYLDWVAPGALGQGGGSSHQRR